MSSSSRTGGTAVVFELVLVSVSEKWPGLLGQLSFSPDCVGELGSANAAEGWVGGVEFERW